MKLLFKSVADGESTSFICDYKIKGNSLLLILPDGNTISLRDEADGLYFKREGKIKQELLFLPQKLTETTLVDENNLEMKFIIYTELVKKALKGYYLKYKLFLDEKLTTEHKIWIKYLD